MYSADLGINNDYDIRNINYHFFFTLAVSVSCCCYLNKVRLGILIDRSAASDELVAERFLKNFAEELRLTHAAI